MIRVIMAWFTDWGLVAPYDFKDHWFCDGLSHIWHLVITSPYAVYLPLRPLGAVEIHEYIVLMENVWKHGLRNAIYAGLEFLKERYSCFIDFNLSVHIRNTFIGISHGYDMRCI